MARNSSKVKNIPKNILVTGGAGYIGSMTCKVLQHNGYTPITLDNLVYGHKEFVKWGPFFKGDIGNDRLIKKIYDKYPFDYVIHFAAYAYVGQSMTEPLLYFENNVSQTILLLKQLIDLKVKF